MRNSYVCLTTSGARDGIGHQVYNRIEVLALASYLNCGYMNPPFSSFDYNYGDGILNEETELSVLKALNRDSIPSLASCSHSIHVGNFQFHYSPAVLRFLIPLLSLFGFLCRKRYLIEINKIHRYVDSGEKLTFRRERIFSKLLNSRFIREFRLQDSQKEKSAKLKVLLIIPWARNATLSARHVPLEFYTDTLRQIIDILKNRQIEFSMRIHTDAVPNLDEHRTRWCLSPETIKYLTEWKILNNGQFSYSYLDFSSDFNFLEDVEYALISNVTPLSIWDDFRDSSLILGSRSALSYSGVFYSKSNSFIILPGNSDIRIPGVHYLDIDFSNLKTIFSELQEFLDSQTLQIKC